MANFNIDSIRNALINSTSNRLNNHGLAATPESQSAIQYKQGALFSTTDGFKEFQSHFTKLLQANGFNPQQANQFLDLLELPNDELNRVFLIAQALQKNNKVFDSYITSLKNIVLRGENIRPGLKGFLDALEVLIGREKLSHLKAEIQTPKIHTAATQGEQKPTQAQQNQNPEKIAHPNEFEKSLIQNLNEQLSRSSSTNSLNQRAHDLENTLRQIANLNKGNAIQIPQERIDRIQEFLRFADVSIKEFPNRYQTDLFAYAHLSELGLSQEKYLQLSSEISPLRLLNLLVAAKAKGHQPQAIINTLSQTFENGGSIKDVIRNLENQYNVLTPKNPDGSERIIPVNAQTATISEGEHALLSFLGLDTNSGIISSEKSSFVIFPQKHEYAGNLLQLAHLPVGTYMIMAKAINDNNEMMTMWVKLLVESRKKKAFDKSFRDFEKELQKAKKDNQEQSADQQNHNQNKQQNFEQNNSQDQSPSSFVPTSSEPEVSVQISQNQPSNFKGPYLGEVILPLDYLTRDCHDLHIVAPETGLITSIDEFTEGVFENNAVVFRFLTNHIEDADLIKRHNLIVPKSSRIFEDFSNNMENFAARPKEELESWKKDIVNFFDSLKSAFPQGSQSFEIAQKFFSQESEKFAEGKLDGEIYQNHSLENDKDKFLKAFYAKGSYALAASGNIKGALQGMSYASLIDLSDQNATANLGSYLDDIRHQFYTKEQDQKLQKFYEMHLSHEIDKKLRANLFHHKTGKDYVAKTQLALPKAKTAEPTKATFNTYRNNFYK
ncbi:MAG: hypothetical protein H7A33_03835 [Deltaproteobacteria bacterium]|nr:hypothetical protein [Deltaproteobacteria bacterium]